MEINTPQTLSNNNVGGSSSIVDAAKAAAASNNASILSIALKSSPRSSPNNSRNQYPIVKAESPSLTLRSPSKSNLSTPPSPMLDSKREVNGNQSGTQSPQRSPNTSNNIYPMIGEYLNDSNSSTNLANQQQLISNSSQNNFRQLSSSEIGYKVRNSPKLIRKYQLGLVLGQGSYGKVREALDTKNKKISQRKLYALKMIKRRNLRKIKGGEASVARELEIMSSVKHPNCLALYDHFENEDKGKLYMVLEYAGGGSVQMMLDSAPNHRIPPAQAQLIFRQLIDAVEYLHLHNIIHRDVKPDNMLLTLNSELKLADFGMACYVNSEELMKGHGSPAFQPPEIAGGGKDISSGFKIDSWAFGISLYLAVVGEFPFEGSNYFNLLNNIAQASFEIPEWIDQQIKDLLLSSLQPDQEKRQTIFQLKLHPWWKATLPQDGFIQLSPIPSDFEDHQNQSSSSSSQSSRRRRHCNIV